MKFKFEHRFDVPVEELEQAMFAEDLPAFLQEHMPSLKGIEVLERQDSENAIQRKVRYEPVPLIKKVGPKKVPPEAMIWVEQSKYDRSRHEMTFENMPTHPKVKNLMTNKGTVRLMASGSGSMRVLEGELKVSVPLLGRVAEKIIFKTAGKVVEEEAAALKKFIAEKK
ncbi:MAG: DUF2505 family protein [Deltaproteobacteria bacterium]|nr:DUF2505 family protein [Deltaproteobacteria bacterium]